MSVRQSEVCKAMQILRAIQNAVHQPNRLEMDRLAVCSHGGFLEGFTERGLQMSRITRRALYQGSKKKLTCA